MDEMKELTPADALAAPDTSAGANAAIAGEKPEEVHWA